MPLILATGHMTTITIINMGDESGRININVSI
jgi:hypothetical protein